MKLPDLLRQIQLRRRLGLPDTEFRQELFRRISVPLAALPASLITIRLAMRRNRRGHLAAALGEGIMVSLLLWTLLTLFRAFGVGGLVSPAMSGIAPVALLLAIGVGLGLAQDLGFRRKPKLAA
jgi:lipopolysaccharide export system permease protein